MIDYDPLYEALEGSLLRSWVRTLRPQIVQAFNRSLHGDLLRWQTILHQMPEIHSDRVSLDSDRIIIGEATDPTAEISLRLTNLLGEFHPWRKGPYEIFGIHIDTEWRSYLKWNRLRYHMAPLTGRLVLDVGCGNGYHCWRMVGAGAELVVGIDPALLNVMQFYAVRQFAGSWPIYVLPIGIEDMPTDLRGFDTVFSMGVLYHRRSPIDHLYELQGCLRPGGELILETLVIDGGLNHVLVPRGRYAKMRNTWFIPTCDTLVSWMERCGFRCVRVIDVSKTTTYEQRSTRWMKFHSLSKFLDPVDPELTCEGYPAPKRAIFLANT